MASYGKQQLFGSSHNNNNNNGSDFNNNNYNTSTTTTAGPRSKCDQVIFEALCKACEIIVGSRTTTTSSSTSSSFSTTNTIIASPYGMKNNSTTTTNHNTTIAGGTTSTRFNLQVPEIPGVRQILSQYKLQLHIPIRLDVYYQHPTNGNREIVERWCFEYRPLSSTTTANSTTAGSEAVSSADGFPLGILSSTNKHHHDAMAQLRHVCKRIVIWLRTLYCFSRLLPAQAFRQHQLQQQQQQHYRNNGGSVGYSYNISSDVNNNNSNNNNNIGFSLYVNQDGADDINYLVQQLNFQQQLTPSGAVTTPYGQLSGCVVYLPSSAIQHLLPKQPKNGIPMMIHQNYHQQQHQNILYHQQQQNYHQNQHQTQSRPIPMNGTNNNNNNINYSTGETSSPDHHQYVYARSAPAVQGHEHPLRIASYSERSQQLQQQAAAVQQQQPQPQHRGHLGTYDPMTLIPPRNSNNNNKNHKNDQQTPTRHLLQRRHTSIGSSGAGTGGDPQATTTNEADKGPERVMSGLSLALMMAGEVGEGTNSGWEDTCNPNANVKVDIAQQDVVEHQVNDVDEVSVPTRWREALHKMPPHLVEQHQQAAMATSSPSQHPSTSGEYGYAYNNHIPLQKMEPNNSATPTTQAIRNVVRTLRSNSYDSRAASPSPFSFLQQHQQQPQNTPPTAAFLGYGHTPPVGPRSGSSSSSFGLLPNGLMAPLSRRGSNNSLGTLKHGGDNILYSLNNGGITPPFRDRPLGFLHEASVGGLATPSITTAPTTESDTHKKVNGLDIAAEADEEDATRVQEHHATLQQLASLDLLHSNPFHLQQQHQQSPSLLSSVLPPVSVIQTATGGLSGGLDSVLTSYTNNPSTAMGWASTGGGFLSSGGAGFTTMASYGSNLQRSSPAGAYHGSDNDLDYYEDTMPFAVDLPESSGDACTNPQQHQQHNSSASVTTRGGLGTDSFLFGQSASLASLAQKCSVQNHRLKFFDSSNSTSLGKQVPSIDNAAAEDKFFSIHQDQDDLVSSLADQLQELRSFGASLQFQSATASTASNGFVAATASSSS